MGAPRRVRILGEGRSSIVLSLPVAEWSTLLPQLVAQHEYVALRMHKLSQASVAEATVSDVLRPYLGFFLWVDMTSDLRDALRESWAFIPEEERRLLRTTDTDLMDVYMRQSASVMLLPDFTARIVDPNGVLAHETNGRPRQLLSSTTFEVKPKASWRRPHWCAARYTNCGAGSGTIGEPQMVVCDLHPRKWVQCRFSQMQVWKACRRGAPRGKRMDQMDHVYCPNKFLCATTVRDFTDALQALAAHPENNFKVINSQLHHAGQSEQPLRSNCDMLHKPEVHAADFLLTAMALKQMDLCQRILSLQRGGNWPASSAPVLDVQLLWHWKRCIESNGSQFELLCDGDLDDEVECACTDASKSQTRRVSANATWIAPPFTFEEAIESFYIATTAKDLSLVTTIERWGHTPTRGDLCGGWSDMASGGSIHYNSGGSIVFSAPSMNGDEHDTPEIALCRVAVIDIDCKRHKALEHYFLQDAEICEAAEQVFARTE